MTRQFEHFGLLDRVHFVRAIGHRSSLVDEHLVRLGIARADRETRAVAACWLSHIRALRSFLREQTNTTAGCIVFEDDVLLHRDWPDRLEEVLANLPQSAAVCSLGYNDEDWIRPYESWEGFAWSGREPKLRNLTAVLTRQWGAHAYWTSREHARDVLHHAETGTPLPSLAPSFLLRQKSLPVPESIQKVPGAFSAFPSLAIQDGTSSSIREDAKLRSQRSAHAAWGVENYFAGDGHMLTKRSPSSPSICLCATVWNDAELIEPLASSLDGLIDSWVICDTGSTDGTPERVTEAFAGIPGRLYRDEWRDDGTNRTLMLERARGNADYLLLLEPDQSLLVHEQLGSLDADAYALPLVDSDIGWVPMLVRGDLPWRAIGAINAELVCDEPYHTEQLELILIRPDKTEPQRTRRLTGKLGRAEVIASETGDRDHLFALAELHRALGDDERAVQLYAQRLQHGGPPEQIWEAMYRHAELVTKRDWEQGVNLLLETWEFLPSRPEPLWSLAHGYRIRNQFAPGELLVSKGLQIPKPEVPPARFRHVYDWGLEYEWSLVTWTNDPDPASRVCGDLLRVLTVPDDLLFEMKDHFWRCYIAATKGARSPLRRGAPTLSSLVPATVTDALTLDFDLNWDLTHPSVASDDDGLRCLLRVRDPENPWATSYCEVELSSELSVVGARIISDERPPGGVPLGAFRRCHLVRCGADYLVVGSPEGAPSGSPAVVLRLLDGRFEESELLVGSGLGTPTRWAPFSSGGELYFLSSFDPVTILNVDQKSGDVTSTRVGMMPDELGEERAASQGISVENGTLFVTNRVLPDGFVEHRFVLLDDEFEVAGATTGFCFLHPIGELCFGLARQDDDLVLSFGAEWGKDPFLARVPYRAIFAMLGEDHPGARRSQYPLRV